MPMERTKLLHIKSTIALPTKYNYQAMSVSRYSIANCYAYRELSVITTYLNDNMLKLHLIDLLSIYCTSKFATNTVTNRTDGA